VLYLLQEGLLEKIGSSGALQRKASTTNGLSRLGREPGQFVDSGAGRVNVVTARRHDVHVGTEHPGPRDRSTN
jgi:hypothetical protein